MTTTRYLIIGMGVAGISAAEAIRTQDPDGEVTLLNRDGDGFYSLPGLAYLLSGEVAEDGLSPWTAEDFRRIGARRVQGEAIRIDIEYKQVVLAAGTRLPYDRLLLATGSRAILPEIPGTRLDGVVKLDNLEDARSILRHSRRAKNAVIVGGGITALEIVEGLQRRGVQTHYLLRGDRYWSNVLAESESQIVERALVEGGVKLHYRTELAEVRGQGGKVHSILTRAGEEIHCRMVALAIGVLPRKELAERSGIQTGRGILVDEHLQTDQPGVYAAGDCAQVYDPRSGKHILDTLWALAREQGKTAGLNMAGANVSYRMQAPCNVTRLAGIPTLIIGSVGKGKDRDMQAIGRGDSESWREEAEVPVVQSDQRFNHLRLMVGPTTLTGAILMGDQRLETTLRALITRQIDISPVRARLLEPGADLIRVLAEFEPRMEGTV
jgi:NAD(P)H-nitrite reductase large subunit